MYDSSIGARNVTYGLKQSVLELYKDLRNAILNGESKSSERDEWILYFRTEDGQMAALPMYVNGIVLTGN